MKIFLNFLYTGIVDDDWKGKARELTDMADRFALPTLKKYIDMNLHHICDVGNAVDILQIAQKYALTAAFENILEYIQSNVHHMVQNGEILCV